MQIKIEQYFIWVYSLALFIIQIVHSVIALGLSTILCLLVIFTNSIKKMFYYLL